MLTFHIPGMTCGGCAGAVTRAIQRTDPHASVRIDVAQREITITSSATEKALLAALQQAGYPAEPRVVHMG